MVQVAANSGISHSSCTHLLYKVWFHSHRPTRRTNAAGFLRLRSPYCSCESTLAFNLSLLSLRRYIIPGHTAHAYMRARSLPPPAYRCKALGTINESVKFFPPIPGYVSCQEALPKLKFLSRVASLLTLDRR